VDSIARRHAIFYSRFLQDEEIIQSRFGEYNLSAFSSHIGNVRAALEWALSDHGDVTVGIALAASAAPLFIGLSLLEECRRWCEGALAALFAGYARSGLRPPCSVSESVRGNGLIYNFLHHTMS
jgi:predicted ATPase